MLCGVERARQISRGFLYAPVHLISFCPQPPVWRLILHPGTRGNLGQSECQQRSGPWLELGFGLDGSETIE